MIKIFEDSNFSINPEILQYIDNPNINNLSMKCKMYFCDSFDKNLMLKRIWKGNELLTFYEIFEELKIKKIYLPKIFKSIIENYYSNIDEFKYNKVKDIFNILWAENIKSILANVIITSDYKFFDNIKEIYLQNIKEIILNNTWDGNTINILNYLNKMI